MMTTEEYFRTPETVLPQELIFGAMRVSDAPFVSHQRVVANLLVALRSHVRQNSLGEVLVAPVDVVLDAARALVVQPDLLFVSGKRQAIVQDRVHGAPDLVIEVLSPRPRIGALDERVEWFARYGVREIWLYEQDDRRLRIIGCRHRRIAGSAIFEAWQPVRSRVLPLSATVADLVDG